MSISELDEVITDAARRICEIVPYSGWVGVLYMQRFSSDFDVTQSRFIVKMEDGRSISDWSDWNPILRTRLSSLLNKAQKLTPSTSGFLREVAILVRQNGEFKTSFQYSKESDIDKFMTGQIEPPPGFE